ncbi:hypothetical protein GCM10010531_24860 [Blastococcus jejuensis]|uniref:Uncharacterized protein n=1 Tax=Blastococcus jejuensis TaxID=351224 RepID=A0ABP6P8R5_9ACTN
MSDPWADPSTPTEHGAPYAGPPTTTPPGAGWAPPGYGAPGYPPSGYPPPGYGYPPPGYGYPAPWPMVPRGPRRPGQVIASAVLAFVQAAMVLIASLYVWFAASIVDVVAADAPGSLDTDTAQGLATEGTVLAIVQVLSAVLLVGAGVLALNQRNRRAWILLLAAHGFQVVLSLYWLVRLSSLAGDTPGPDAGAVFFVFTLFFAAGPLVGLGLILFGDGRRWFDTGTAPAPQG